MFTLPEFLAAISCAFVLGCFFTYAGFNWLFESAKDCELRANEALRLGVLQKAEQKELLAEAVRFYNAAIQKHQEALRMCDETKVIALRMAETATRVAGVVDVGDTSGPRIGGVYDSGAVK